MTYVIYFILIYIFWIVLNIFIGSTLNQSGLKNFVISFFLSPLIGSIVVLATGQKGKKCEKCAELVKVEAIVCKHCGFQFPQDPEALRIKKMEVEYSKLISERQNNNK